MEFLSQMPAAWQFALQLAIVFVCLFYGSRKGGIALGMLGGVGLFVMVFAFGVAPGKPAVSVMLTILAVVVASATLQTAGGLDVMLSLAERILRRNPRYISILAPLCTCTLTVLCGTGHVVYTMLPIVYDVAIKNGIRPERPMAASSVSAQLGIIASPVSVAVVTLSAFVINSEHHLAGFDGYLDLLKITIPSTYLGVLCVGIYSWFRGKELSEDADFQALISTPEGREQVYGAAASDAAGQAQQKVLSKGAWASMWIFLAAIAAVAILGYFSSLRPQFGGKPLGMVATIQIFMLFAGALIVIATGCKAGRIASSEIFRSGMVALVAVFGISWMADSMVAAHTEMIKAALGGLLTDYPASYAVVLIIISKLVNSQAAALVAFVPLALSVGVSPAVILAFAPACYGYFILPTYPSDLAAIQFDRSGTTKIGRFVINHSFIIPGFVGVICSCCAGYALAGLYGYL